MATVVSGEAKIVEVKWMLPFGNLLEIEMGQAKKELLEIEVVEKIVAQSHLSTMVVEQLLFKHCHDSCVWYHFALELLALVQRLVSLLF